MNVITLTFDELENCLNDIDTLIEKNREEELWMIERYFNLDLKKEDFEEMQKKRLAQQACMEGFGFREVDPGDCFLRGYYLNGSTRLSSGFLFENNMRPFHKIMRALGNYLYKKKNDDYFVLYRLERDHLPEYTLLTIGKQEKEYCFLISSKDDRVVLEEIDGKIKDIVLNESNVQEEMDTFFKLFRLSELFTTSNEHFDRLFVVIEKEFHLKKIDMEGIKKSILTHLENHFTTYKIESESYKALEKKHLLFNRSGGFCWFMFLDTILVFETYLNQSYVYIFTDAEEAKTLILNEQRQRIDQLFKETKSMYDFYKKNNY